MNPDIKPPEIVLSVKPETTYSRPGVEFSVTLNLSRRPQGITTLRFPQHLLWRQERHAIPTGCSPGALQLHVSLSRVSHSENLEYDVGTIKICSVCQRREAKRANRRRQQTSTDRNKHQESRVLVLNTNAIQLWQNCSTPHDASNGSLFVKLKARILCECRHHKETLGFNLNCTLSDYKGNVVARSSSIPIMIRDKAFQFSPSRIGTHPFLHILEPQLKNHMRHIDQRMLQSLTRCLKFWKPSPDLRLVDSV